MEWQTYVYDDCSNRWKETQCYLTNVTFRCAFSILKYLCTSTNRVDILLLCSRTFCVHIQCQIPIFCIRSRRCILLLQSSVSLAMCVIVLNNCLIICHINQSWCLITSYRHIRKHINTKRIPNISFLKLSNLTTKLKGSARMTCQFVLKLRIFSRINLFLKIYNEQIMINFLPFLSEKWPPNCYKKSIAKTQSYHLVAVL